MIVDAQIQFWKKEFLSPIACTFIKNMFNIMQTELTYEATPEKYIAEMQEAEIDKAIISTNDFSYESNTSQIKYNNYIAEIVKEYPDLFLGLCGVDPRRKNAIEIFQKGLDAGLCGLKLYPGTGFRPDDEICMPLYKIAEENEVPVSFHTGFTASPFSIQLSNPLLLEDVLEQFPNLKVIASTQLSYPYTFDLAALMRKYEYVYTDCAPTNLEVPDIGIAQNIISIKIMVVRQRIMFASNWPFCIGRLKEWTDKTLKIKLPSLSRLIGLDNVTKEDREYINGITACELFKIKIDTS